MSAKDLCDEDSEDVCNLSLMIIRAVAAAATTAATTVAAATTAVVVVVVTTVLIRCRATFQLSRIIL